MKRREFVRMIEAVDWSPLREDEHCIYVKYALTFPVPRHTEISPGVVRSWHKKGGR